MKKRWINRIINLGFSTRQDNKTRLVIRINWVQILLSKSKPKSELNPFD